MAKEQKKLSRKEVKKQINELIQELDKEVLTKSKSKSKSKPKIESNEKDDLQELLDYLKVAIKYTLFDLEATRRENEKLLNDKNENL